MCSPSHTAQGISDWRDSSSEEVRAMVRGEEGVTSRNQGRAGARVTGVPVCDQDSVWGDLDLFLRFGC